MDQKIWSRLQEIAAENNFETQEALAEYIGMHSHYLSAIKNGRRSFGPTWIRKICNKLKVTEEWLFTNKERRGDKEDEKSMKEEIKKWKTIAENWERQYRELKFMYDELKANPRMGESLKS